MDPTRFDAATKRLATLGSRRRVVALAAAALGWAGFDRAGAVACRGDGRLCLKDANCCSQRCVSDAVGRRQCGPRCLTAGACCGDPGTCSAVCCTHGAGFNPGRPCGAGGQWECSLAGPGQPCGSDADCNLGGVCPHGVCCFGAGRDVGSSGNCPLCCGGACAGGGTTCA